MYDCEIGDGWAGVFFLWYSIAQHGERVRGEYVRTRAVRAILMTKLASAYNSS